MIIRGPAREVHAVSVYEPEWTNDWTVNFRTMKRRERLAPGQGAGTPRYLGGC
jgi:hypothetical protein